MEIKELKGKDIMMAYDGNYLAPDFGYSCANFNVRDSWGGGFFESWGGEENDEATFDFYTKNTKNVSCFVCYNDQNKIWGRRMFFKGPSMINDDEFDFPLKKGQQVNYLYGYYGSDKNGPLEMITQTAIKKYGKGILYTDRVVLTGGSPNYGIRNLWVMQVEKTDFGKYPPIDVLSVSTELNALANFHPKKYVLEVLERDFNIKDVEFNSAYRFVPGGKKVKYDYKTWDYHHGTIKSPDDYTKIIEEEEEDDEEVISTDIKIGDAVAIIDNKEAIYIPSRNLFADSALSKGTRIGIVVAIRIINGIPCIEIAGNGNLYKIKNVKKI